MMLKERRKLNQKESIMKRIRVNEHFYSDEYLPFLLYKEYESKGRIHRLMDKFDDRLLNADLEIRKYMGEPVTINNWWNFAKDRNFNDSVDKVINDTIWLRQWSGFRTPESSDYSRDSQHSWFNASDKISDGRLWLPKMQLFIIENWKDLGIKFMEVGITWCHTDTRNIPSLKLYNPYKNIYVSIKDYKEELKRKLKS